LSGKGGGRCPYTIRGPLGTKFVMAYAYNKSNKKQFDLSLKVERCTH